MNNFISIHNVNPPLPFPLIEKYDLKCPLQWLVYFSVFLCSQFSKDWSEPPLLCINPCLANIAGVNWLTTDWLPHRLCVFRCGNITSCQRRSRECLESKIQCVKPSRELVRSVVSFSLSVKLDYFPLLILLDFFLFTSHVLESSSFLLTLELQTHTDYFTLS